MLVTFVKLQIIDEKSLIKKYQNEIRCLKEELDQLKRGIDTVPQLKDTGGDHIVLLKQKVVSEVSAVAGVSSFSDCCFISLFKKFLEILNY